MTDTYCLTLRCPVALVEKISAELWTVQGVVGLEERPIDGTSLFKPDEAFEILEFGSEAALRCAEWMDQEGYRGDGELILKVYLEAEAPASQAHKSLSELLARHSLTVEDSQKVIPEDYLQKYKDSVRGSEAGEALWVGPPWASVPEGRQPFFIEPGLAFGTGDHPTTQLCLARLYEHKNRNANFKKILDLGTGSGILGVAAKKFFPQAALVLSDSDPLCAAESTKNFKLNNEAKAGVQEFYGSEGLAASLLQKNLGPFDLLISNIYAEVLAQISSELWQLLAPGGLWIASGILEGEPENKLLKACEAWGAQPRFRQVMSRSGSELSAAKGLERLTETWVLLEFKK